VVRGWRQHPARTAAFTALGLVIAVVGASFPLFVFPAKDSPGPVDAIVVLGGDDRRLTLGRKLAAEGYASTLLISAPGGLCPYRVPNVRVVCFRPDPSTTQGEARSVAKAERENGWKSLIVISSTDQTTRARIRFKRCTDVKIRYVPSAISAGEFPFRIAYEWGALAKALIWQRGC
jgi:uncharacterized SAM-binding protein YcdF (DUF218 family)